MKKKTKLTLYMICLVSICCSFIVYLGLHFITQKNTRVVNADFVRAFGFLEFDDKYGWINRRNSENSVKFSRLNKNVSLPEIFYKIDADGLRTSKLLEKSKLRNPSSAIWVFGDSSPFGFGVENVETFSHILALHYLKRNISVSNFSVGGYNTIQTVSYLNEVIGDVNREKPKVLIVWVGFNNVAFSKDLFYEKDAGSEFIDEAQFRNDYSEIFHIASENNIELIVNTIPYTVKRKSLEKVNKFFRSLPSNKFYLNDVNATFIELGNSLDLFAQWDSIAPFYYHPGPRGHAVVAKMLIPVLDRLLAKAGKSKSN